MSFSDADAYNLAMNPHAGDDKMFVEFKMHPMLDGPASDEAKRPIYRDVEFVSIIQPGSRDEYFQPAREEHKARFRKQYENFKAGQADAVVGTPLALLPGVSPAQIEEFAFFKIRTVEALAGIPDSVGRQFGAGITELKRKAQAFLDQSNSDAPLRKVQTELESRDAELALLKMQLAELTTTVNANKAKK